MPRKQVMSQLPTILIVDDDDAIRRLIATILAGRDYEFRYSGDAPSAVASMHEKTPALVILDVNVPGQGGGLGVLDHIRGEASLAEVKVLLVSGVAEAYTDGWGVSLGADGHLAKPFELAALRDAVAGLVGSS